MAEYTEPILTLDGVELSVEQLVAMTRNATNAAMREHYLLHLCLHENEYPCPKLRRTIAQLRASVGYTPFQKPPTDTFRPQPGAELPNSVFVTRLRNYLNREREEWIDIDMYKLHYWIKTYFMSQCKHRYSWLALYCFFKDKDMLKGAAIADFGKQMSLWFYPQGSDDKSIPNDDAMQTYSGYLTDTPYTEWTLSDFQEHKHGKQSDKGYEHLKKVCTELASSFVPARLSINKQQDATKADDDVD